jgi:hypothetical protein
MCTNRLVDYTNRLAYSQIGMHRRKSACTLIQSVLYWIGVTTMNVGFAQSSVYLKTITSGKLM